jgi:hypothetical protein
MAFRGYESGGPEFLRDPLARFRELDAALETRRGLLADRNPQRLAAVNLVLTPGDPAAIAEAVHALQQRFAQRVSFVKANPLMHLVLSAIMLRHGDTADGLADELTRVRPIMRSVGLRWAPAFELIAIVALRVQARGPIVKEQIERMHAIYEAMKRNHWWLTGPDDFPACALLSARPGAPDELADRAHAIYERLRQDQGMRRGDALQAVSNVLALADAEPEHLTGRFGVLVEEFRRSGQVIRFDRYDEVALLCFLPRSSASVVETVIAYDAALREHVKWYERLLAFTFAANLAFVHIVGNDLELGPLADVKALLDMYWVLQQQG